MIVHCLAVFGDNILQVVGLEIVHAMKKIQKKANKMGRRTAELEKWWIKTIMCNAQFGTVMHAMWTSAVMS